MSDYKLYKKSPFSPGNIVNPENFVGRENIIKNIINIFQTFLMEKIGTFIW